MSKITINNIDYEVVNNYNDAIDIEQLTNKITDYFDNFDYICGDWAYGNLRLKGFNDKGNKNFKKINDIKNLDNYIKDYCAYGCKWFLIKKMK
ncbi:MAG: YutD family protein [Bacilli bacterium]|nr:YutD family protein [Bacilli bacterium]